MTGSVLSLYRTLFVGLGPDETRGRTCRAGDGGRTDAWAAASLLLQPVVRGGVGGFPGASPSFSVRGEMRSIPVGFVLVNEWMNRRLY